MPRTKGALNTGTLKRRDIRIAMENFVFDHKDALILRLSKDPNYIRYLFDQVIGKAQESIDISGGLHVMYLPSEVITKNGINASTKEDRDGSS